MKRVEENDKNDKNEEQVRRRGGEEGKDTLMFTLVVCVCVL